MNHTMQYLDAEKWAAALQRPRHSVLRASVKESDRVELPALAVELAGGQQQVSSWTSGYRAVSREISERERRDSNPRPPA